MKKKKLIVRFSIHVGLMVAAVLAIAISSHFLLRSGTRHGARRTVPTFKGISLPEAELLAQANDLILFINDSLYVPAYAGGTVLDQLPASGVEVKPGRTVYVVINAYGDRMVTIPYVAGRSLRQAKNMLDVAGFEISRIKYTSDMATNYVLKQSYRGRDIDVESTLEAPAGSGIELTVGVSENDPYTRMPNVIGLSLKEAKSRLWESGLNVGRIDLDQGVDLLKDKGAKVYIQGRAANQNISWGTSISLKVTLDAEKLASAVEEARKADLEYEKSLRNPKKEEESAEVEQATEQSPVEDEDDPFFE